MSDDLFDDPGSADRFSPSDHEGRLLLIKPLEYLTGINTANGVKDAIRSDIHILDGPRAGEVLHSAYVFPLVMIGQLKGNIGRLPNLGRLGKDAPQPGKNAAWKLSIPTDADKDLARRYLASDKYKENNTAPVAAAAPAAADPWGAANSADAPF